MGYQPVYDRIVSPLESSGSSRVEFDFKGNGVPLNVELVEHPQGNLIERIQLGDKIATVVYKHNGVNKVADQIEIARSEGSVYPAISLQDISPSAETTFESSDGQSRVSLFSTHPDMNPRTMFGGNAQFLDSFQLSKEGDQSWVIHFDGEDSGFTVPMFLPNDQKLSEGSIPFDLQIFALPNKNFLPPEYAGFNTRSVPFAIGRVTEPISQTEGPARPKLIALAQRFGHTKVVADMLLEGSQRGLSESDIVGYFVPTPDTLTRIEINKASGMDPDMVKGWCYGPEKGYGGENLPLDPTEPGFSKTMLAFMATNSGLVKDVLGSTKQGVVIYSDTKQDAIFLNMLARMMGVDARVVTKTYSHFENADYFGPKGRGSELNRVIARARQAAEDAPVIFGGLGYSSEAPSFLEFMYWKTMAAFGEGSFSLYSTSGGNANVPERLGFRMEDGSIVGGSEVIPIPLAFFGIESGDRTPRDSARIDLLRSLQDMEIPNISPEMYQRLADDPELNIVALQLGTSDNLYAEEAMETVIAAAQDKRLKDTLVLLTGYRNRKRYLQKLKTTLGIVDESQLPPNVAVLGMRSDITRIQAAIDAVITPAGMGNLNDAIRGETPLVMLAPDTVTQADEDKLRQLNGHRTAERLRDDIAVMVETGIERALNCSLIARAYADEGLPPNSTIIDLTQRPTPREVAHDIAFALENGERMVNALKRIPTVPVNFLLDVLEQARDGKSTNEIRRFVIERVPGFSPTILPAQEAKPVTLNI